MKLFEALNQQFSEFRQGIGKMLWGVYQKIWLMTDSLCAKNNLSFYLRRWYGIWCISCLCLKKYFYASSNFIIGLCGSSRIIYCSFLSGAL